MQRTWTNWIRINAEQKNTKDSEIVPQFIKANVGVSRSSSAVIWSIRLLLHWNQRVAWSSHKQVSGAPYFDSSWNQASERTAYVGLNFLSDIPSLSSQSFQQHTIAWEPLGSQSRFSDKLYLWALQKRKQEGKLFEFIKSVRHCSSYQGKFDPINKLERLWVCSTSRNSCREKRVSTLWAMDYWQDKERWKSLLESNSWLHWRSLIDSYSQIYWGWPALQLWCHAWKGSIKQRTVSLHLWINIPDNFKQQNDKEKSWKPEKNLQRSVHVFPWDERISDAWRNWTTSWKTIHQNIQKRNIDGRSNRTHQKIKAF